MKVSVCIPAYKHPDFLKRCLDSVLEQEFSDFEVIITDDSPDNSLEKLINTYNDNRIVYIKNEKNLGSPRNWNKGITKARGEYIKMLHHDDWFASPKSLGKFVALLDNNDDLNIAFAGCCTINEKGEKKLHTIKPSFLKELQKHPETVYKGNCLGDPSVCIFKNNKNYLFDPQLIWLVDTDFYIRIISENNKFIYNPELLVNVGISQHQITQQCMEDITIAIKEGIYLFNKFKLNEKDPEYRKTLVRTLGRDKIFTNNKLNKIIPNAEFQMTQKDTLFAYYYFIKKKIRNLF